MRLRTGVVAATVVVAGVTAVLLVLRPADRPSPSPQAAGCRRAAADHAAGLRAPVTPGAPGLVVVIGDSYSQGAGLPAGPADGFPALLARATGRTVHLDGFGSTGFTTRGYCSSRPVTYGERISADGLLALRPTTVVVEGGVNDARNGRPDGVGPAAADVLRLLAAVPQVIVVGPADVRADPRRLDTVDGALAADTAAAGRQYVDLRQERLALQPDGVHPTREGQAVIAALLVPLLAASDGGTGS